MRKTERLRSEVLAYKATAAAARRGSAEQIAAANLAARAEGRLASSMGVAAHEAARLRGHAGGLERDIGRASRGALAGSGIFRGLGRSIAFASGGFLAFATGGQFIRTSIDAAKEAQVTQKQLGTQLRDDGKSFATYRGEIDKTGLRLSALSGFTKDQLDQALTTILRSTKNVGKALRDEGTAADLARSKHISLSQAALILGKVEANNTTLLRRQGFAIGKHATAEEALAIVRAKVAGQARAGTTEQERFGAVLHDSEVIIGTGLLPTLNQYLAKGAAWLTQMNESGRLQKDVANITGDVVKGFHYAGEAAQFVQGVFRQLDRVTGSLENTLKLFAAAWLLTRTQMKLVGWARAIAGVRGIGTAATVAEAEMGGLRLAMLALAGPDVLAALAAGAAAYAGYKSVTTQTYPGAKPTAANDANSTSAGAYTYQRGGKTYKVFPGGKPGRGVEQPGSTDFTGPKPFPYKPSFRPGKIPPPSAPPTARGTSLMGQFNIDELKLADAERKNQTALQRQILVSEEGIVLKLRDQAKTLKDRTKYAQQAASLQSSIDSIDSAAAQKLAEEKRKRQAAADKAKKAREKAALGGVSLSLQLKESQADALATITGATDPTKQQIAAARAIRAAEVKAIRSHKLSMQGLIDAWNEIGRVSSIIDSPSGYKGTYHKATSSITKGLHLSHDQAIAIRERAAQRDAHRGFVPSGPAAQGQPVVHVGTVNVHGVQNPDKLWSELEKVGKRRGQRRGTR